MNIGDTITDGNVVWKLRRIDKAVTADSTPLATKAMALSEQHISDNEDLNADRFMKTGFYSCPSNTSAKTLKNRPSDLTCAFLMIVSEHTARLQVIFEINGFMYIRNNDYWNDEWHRSSWYKFNQDSEVGNS